MPRSLALLALAALTACARHPAVSPLAVHKSALPSDAGASPSAAACRIEPDLLVPGMGAAAGTPESPRMCLTHRAGALVSREIRQCPPAVTEAVAHWEPDVIVALGGGIIEPHHPGCATQQRAWSAYEFFEALGRRPSLLFSGHGPKEEIHPLEPAEAKCASARIASELAMAHGADEGALRAERDAVEAHRVGRLTEADYLCAVVLRQYDPRDWGAVIARVVFEARSFSTVDNAEFSAPLIARHGFRRALVVSTPVMHNGGEDNHPYRALCDFKTAREHTAWFRLAAVGCPFTEDGAAWGEFD